MMNREKQKASYSVQAKACIHSYEVGRSFNLIPEGRKNGKDEEMQITEGNVTKKV
jgi:hypothetical protein